MSNQDIIVMVYECRKFVLWLTEDWTNDRDKRISLTSSFIKQI